MKNNRAKKDIEPTKREGKTKLSFYTKDCSQIKRAFMEKAMMEYKEYYLNLDEINQSLHSLTFSLLHKFEDLFPN